MPGTVCFHAKAHRAHRPGHVDGDPVLSVQGGRDVIRRGRRCLTVDQADGPARHGEVLNDRRRVAPRGQPEDLHVVGRDGLGESARLGRSRPVPVAGAHHDDRPPTPRVTVEVGQRAEESSRKVPASLGAQLGEVREVGEAVGGGRLQSAGGAGVDPQLSYPVEVTEQLDRSGLLTTHRRQRHIGGGVDHEGHVELVCAEVLDANRSGALVVEGGECGGSEHPRRHHIGDGDDDGGRQSLPRVQRDNTQSLLVVRLRRARDRQQRHPEHDELRR